MKRTMTLALLALVSMALIGCGGGSGGGSVTVTVSSAPVHVHSAFCDIYPDFYDVDHTELLHFRSHGLTWSEIGLLLHLGYESFLYDAHDAFDYYYGFGYDWNTVFVLMNVSTTTLFINDATWGLLPDPLYEPYAAYTDLLTYGGDWDFYLYDDEVHRLFENQFVAFYFELPVVVAEDELFLHGGFDLTVDTLFLGM
jgi:hypothetical protein